jgi:hypothetical protein
MRQTIINTIYHKNKFNTTTEKTWSYNDNTMTNSNNSTIDNHNDCTLTSMTTKMREENTTTTTTEYLSATSEEPTAKNANKKNDEWPFGNWRTEQQRW